MLKKSLIIFLAFFCLNVYAEGVSKKVCHDKEAKGKTTKVCKIVKVHKKVDDTTVVPAKKK
jgi:uncharacterized membrane protein YjfL (UPF0719 family)